MGVGTCWEGVGGSGHLLGGNRWKWIPAGREWVEVDTCWEGVGGSVAPAGRE